ncbi:MAG: acyltransferase family protein [Actinomycetota bacterium]|nr:acyltransferase family protein [Actinomycetota bacterium]
MNKRSDLLTYIPSLDGIRALSVLAVIVYHANKLWLPGGFLGVEVFFVISGYLITLLLLAESEKSGTVSLKQFWLRRARRLLPALWVVVLGVVVFAALFQREILGTLRGDVVAALFYGFNWFQIWVGTSYFTSFEFVPLRHLWSLAVEEQFYLIWPIVMLVVAKFGKRRLPIVSVVFFGAAVALAIYTGAVYQPGTISTIGDTPEQFMSLFGQSVSRVDFLFLGTLTRSSGLLLGAALAIWWRPWLLQNSRAGASKLFDVVGFGGLVALALMMWRFQTVIEGTDAGTVGYDLLFQGGFFLTDVASVALIAAAVHPGSKVIAKTLSNPVLVWLGRRSYGFYLFHWPVFQFYRRFAGQGLTPYEFVVLVLLALALTELSFRYVETPVRQGALSRWWAEFRQPAYGAQLVRRQRRIVLVALASVLPVFGFVSLATARVALDEIAQNLSDNEGNTVDVLGSGQSVGGDATSATTVTTIAGQVVTATTSLDGQVIDVLAIGDSVMLGAANVLTRRGVTVDAMKSRPYRQALEIANFMKSVNRLGSVVIIHLGTNNTVDELTLDEIMVPLRDVPLVLFVTVHVPSEVRQSTNNQRINELPAKYENVKVLDWYSVALAHPEYLYSDKIHIRPEGQKIYADLMMQAIGRP